MYKTQKTYINPELKVATLINENPRLLLLLEHLNMDFTIGDKNVTQLCKENSIPIDIFIVFGNLYNGFNQEIKEIQSKDAIQVILRFLKNSHLYYKTDKYPELIGLIRELQDKTGNSEVKLIERFFSDYFGEVLDHLDYEEKIAFPYFLELIEPSSQFTKSEFSVKEYRDHHSDIETKLSDLKNLLLIHIKISDELSLRRKLFFSLLELEFDLMIHALIEEKILLPLIMKVEKSRSNG
ncbi:MAG: hemerythrin domain-containing protein [Deltaproteobacteria bacterium]